LKAESRRQKTEDRGRRAEGISNIEQGMSNDEVEIALLCGVKHPKATFEGATQVSLVIQRSIK